MIVCGRRKKKEEEKIGEKWKRKEQKSERIEKVKWWGERKEIENTLGEEIGNPIFIISPVKQIH